MLVRSTCGRAGGTCDKARVDSFAEEETIPGPGLACLLTAIWLPKICEFGEKENEQLLDFRVASKATELYWSICKTIYNTVHNWAKGSPNFFMTLLESNDCTLVPKCLLLLTI